MPTNATYCRTLGVRRTSREDEMLPNSIKELLNNSPYKFSAKAIALSFQRGVEIEQVVRKFHMAVGKHLADTEMLRTWGARHPQAVVTGRCGPTLKELDL